MPITPKKVKTNTAKNIVFALGSICMFGVLIGGIVYTYKIDQREVEIVKFNHDVAIGSEITGQDIEIGTILQAEYNARAKSEWIANDGTPRSGQIYIKWDDADKILGMYVTNARRTGDAVTLRDITKDEIEPNPWFSEVPVGNELYTLKFNPSDTYTRMLLPGCTIRMRIIQDVAQTDEQTVRKIIESKTKEAEESSDEDFNGYISAYLPYYVKTTTDDGSAVNKKEAKDVPVAEIVFDNLVMLDALNNQGESIFDIYYALVNMESTVRENYIREK